MHAESGPHVPQRPRHPRALILSAALHVALGLAWMFAPSFAPRDMGAGAMTVELLAEAPKPEPELPQPPAPQPPTPQPPTPQPPAPQPARPAPSPVAKAAARAAPRPPPAPSPATAEAAATSDTATQPVMSGPPAAASPAATSPAAASPAADSVAVGTPQARSVDRDDYLRLIWARIMRYRPERVPFAGLTRLRFAVAADGQLLAVEVAESSGSGMLDRAALDAVRRAAPFPPPPPLGAESLRFDIPFQFRQG